MKQCTAISVWFFIRKTRLGKSGDTPLTRKKNVDALCLTSNLIRSNFSRISSAGEGNPAFTSPRSALSNDSSVSILCGTNSFIAVAKILKLCQSKNGSNNNKKANQQ